jgi:hypothetical protein
MIALILLLGMTSFSLDEHCDVVEINHQHCGTTETYQQAIFGRWSHEQNEYHVREWRILRPDYIPPQANGVGYAFHFFDDNALVFRSVQSSHFRESWTTKDPERENAKLLGEANRIRVVKHPRLLEVAE